jgi:hypothetical protein
MRRLAANGRSHRALQRAVDAFPEFRGWLRLFQLRQLFGHDRDLTFDVRRLRVLGQMGLELSQLLWVDRAVNTGP